MSIKNYIENLTSNDVEQVVEENKMKKKTLEQLRHKMKGYEFTKVATEEDLINMAIYQVIKDLGEINKLLRKYNLKEWKNFS